MGKTKDWSNNLDRLNEETAMHPSKPFPRGNNYFSQPGGESTKPNLTPCEPSLTQDTFIGGGDTKQKTQREMTTNEAGDPRETTEKLKKTTSQNPGIKETTKSNPAQILLSGHSNEATEERGRNPPNVSPQQSTRNRPMR